MRVRNFILAESIAGNNGLFFLHAAGITSIASAQFPCVHPKLSFFVTLVRERHDTKDMHNLKVELIDPQGQSPHALADGQVQIPDVHDDGDPLCIQFVGEATGVHFPSPGIYSVVLSWDGEELDRIRLALGTPPAPGGGAGA